MKRKKISPLGSSSPSTRPAASNRSAKGPTFGSIDVRPLYRNNLSHPDASPTLKGEKKGSSTGVKNVLNPCHNEVPEAHASNNVISPASLAVVAPVTTSDDLSGLATTAIESVIPSPEAPATVTAPQPMEGGLSLSLTENFSGLAPKALSPELSKNSAPLPEPFAEAQATVTAPQPMEGGPSLPQNLSGPAIKALSPERSQNLAPLPGPRKISNEEQAMVNSWLPTNSRSQLLRRVEENDRECIPSNVKFHKDFPLPKDDQSKAHYGRLIREYHNTFWQNEERVQRVKACERLASILGPRAIPQNNLPDQGSQGVAGAGAAAGAQPTAAGARGSLKRRASTSTGGAGGSPWLDAAKRAKTKVSHPYGVWIHLGESKGIITEEEFHDVQQQLNTLHVDEGMACFITGAPLTSLSVQNYFFCRNRGRLNCLDLITRDWYTKNVQLCKNANGVAFKAWTNEEYRDTFIFSTYVSNVYLSKNSATNVVKVYMHQAGLLGSVVRHEHTPDIYRGVRVSVVCSRVDKDLLIKKKCVINAGINKMLFKEWVFRKPAAKLPLNLGAQSGQQPPAADQPGKPMEIESAAPAGQFNTLLNSLADQPDEPIETDQAAQPEDLLVMLGQPTAAAEFDQQGLPVSCSFDDALESLTIEQQRADTLDENFPDVSQDCEVEFDNEASNALLDSV